MFRPIFAGHDNGLKINQIWGSNSIVLFFSFVSTKLLRVQSDGNESGERWATAAAPESLPTTERRGRGERHSVHHPRAWKRQESRLTIEARESARAEGGKRKRAQAQHKQLHNSCVLNSRKKEGKSHRPRGCEYQFRFISARMKRGTATMELIQSSS